jgi:hypothetical protein
MSLTSILDYNNKDFKEFRSLLSDSFPAPKFKLDRKIKSAPLTKNPRLIGKAFDYLLRFHLKKKYGQKVHERQWVAESALKSFNDKDNGTVYTKRGELDKLTDDELLKLFHGKGETDKIRNKKVHERFNECREIYNQFILSTLKDETDLVKSTLFLGQLDSVVREGQRAKEFVNLLPEDEFDISDLKLLIENCDLNIFQPKHKLILNPTFGAGTKLVGGADADLIIDDTLIDIKVTKDLNLTRPNYNQLIGYYLLFLIGGVDDHKDIIIKNLGLYFARHQVLWTIKVDEIADKEQFDKAKDYLKRAGKKTYRQQKVYAMRGFSVSIKCNFLISFSNVGQSGAGRA